jgi:hypothetical protein
MDLETNQGIRTFWMSSGLGIIYGFRNMGNSIGLGDWYLKGLQMYKVLKKSMGYLFVLGMILMKELRQKL